MTAWRTMNIGALIIILGVDILLLVGPLASNPLLSLPVFLLTYGVWLLVLALLKQLGRPSIYEYPPLMVGSWGILVGGTGFLWLTAALTNGTVSVLALGVFIVIIGVLLVVYSLVKK